MTQANWIELAMVLLLLLGMVFVKLYTRKKVSSLEGLGEVNRNAPGRGEIMGEE